jgi:hypothetical protein
VFNFSFFQCLLPKGCYCVKPHSDVYVESYLCNFLGLNPAVSIPAHVSKNEPFLLVDIYEPDNRQSSDEKSLENYRFMFSSEVNLGRGELNSLFLNQDMFTLEHFVTIFQFIHRKL